jgi:urease accessory protein
MTMGTTTTATLLLLADGRLPAGGHAHSGGLEAVGRLDLVSLESFLLGRLRTVGLVAAGVAAAACRSPADVAGLEVETDARMPSPATREASRRQGRQLVRVASLAWPSPLFAALPRRPHHPVALGVTAAAAGLDPADAALVAAHSSVTGPASAAVRLLSLDPLAVQALLARLAPEVDAVAARAASESAIPAAGAPRLELAAEDHATWEVRLFAS